MVHVIDMLPIRKVSPSRVALTSYYNKTFVERSSRATNDLGRWIGSQIVNIGLDDEDQRITNLKLSNVFDPLTLTPRMYSIVAQRVSEFKAGKDFFYFDYNKRVEFFSEKYGFDVKALEAFTSRTLIGVQSGKTPITMDMAGMLYLEETESTEYEVFEELFKLNIEKAPLEIVEVSVANKTLPMGIVLGYQFGLTRLIEILDVEVTRVPKGERVEVPKDMIKLVFGDEVLYYSRYDRLASMVLSGFSRYHQSIRQFLIHEFDKKDVYGRLLMDQKLGIRYLREITSLFKSWVDPITEDLLKQMGEPTDFSRLLIRSAVLLLNDQSPPEVDGAFMRYRGYERVAGMIYNELTRSAKTANARHGSQKSSLDLNPHAVWQRIVQDPSVQLVEEPNPIANLREQEAYTFRGDGGRGPQSMVERTRMYHDSDVGTVSESTVDSGDVGVIAYLVPDANFDSMRGTTRRIEDTDGPAKYLSSAALLSPAADKDDPKRINFISIQHQQGTFAKGYEVMPLRTGYEQVIAHRCSDKFASTALQDGKITSVTKEGISVEYADGTKAKYPLGKQQTKAAGLTYPQELSTEFKVNDSFSKGDILTYNRNYFKPDPMNKNQVAWMAGALCTTAIMDTIDTLEDGSVISAEMASKLITRKTEVRVVQVRFDQVIRDLVKVGQPVDIDSILCVIEDADIAGNSALDEVSQQTLRRLQALAPKSKYEGQVTKIECYYHGDPDEISPSLKTIVEQSDKERARLAKAAGEEVFTGQVFDDSFRIQRGSLDLDTVALMIYIEREITMGKGDKAVFGNQMKTVISHVMTGENRTEDGRPLDAKFGNTSIEDRMVLSPKVIGTTNTLLKVLSKRVSKIYRGEDT